MLRLGAASLVTEDILNTDEVRRMVGTAQIFYLPGFSLSLDQQLVRSSVLHSYWSRSNEALLLLVNYCFATAAIVCSKAPA